MPDILHKVGIRTSPARVYESLTTIDGLSNWWVRDTQGDNSVNGVVKFRFAEKGGFDMKIRELTPSSRVLWEVVDGPEEWIGTEISFDLSQDDDQTIVLFKHMGWKEPVEFMHHCSTKWAIFLMSLKSLGESGTGAPFPDDVKIDNWN